MNDFAKSQLMKYGWTEGKGLGKHENGITQALRPKLKFDTVGMGHGDKEWNNWWESGFNKAANSIMVESDTCGVSISVSKENATDDFTKEDPNKNKPKNIYENFLKTSTLLNGNLIGETNVYLPKNKSITESVTQVPLTDEELFNICGGRTAHKGARHGLMLNGKLKRIAEQEEDLLNRSSCISVSEKLRKTNDPQQDDKHRKINDGNTVSVIKDLSHRLNTLCNVSDTEKKVVLEEVAKDELKWNKKEKSRKRKRKKEKRKDSIPCNVESIEKEDAYNKLDDISLPVAQNLEKQITEKTVQEQLNNYVEFDQDRDISVRKKKKKKKLKEKKYLDNQYENIINTWEDEEIHNSKRKKFKKSHKNIDFSTKKIKYEDGNMLDHNTFKCYNYEFQTEFSCNNVPVEYDKNRDSSVHTVESFPADTYFKQKIAHINAKIKKKKRAKLRKKEKIKLIKITESLEAVHFNTEEETVEKNIEEKSKAIVKKIMATDITTDKTKSLKKKRKQSVHLKDF
ncbi:uncharacterized protein LOC143432608 [Xylocopa sonorina]|uniref:uncharacterized protein LOC143432608 n=1 Tax=Xylocopa sonorina TaxID=1818115 RepID=UPI00403B3734